MTVIEDCAQSIGAKWNGTPTGAIGKMACTSFYPTKNLGALGDGGAILTNSNDLDKLARSLRDYGQNHKYKHDLIGWNSRLDEIHAAFLSSVALPRLQAWTARRKKIADAYLSNIHQQAVRSIGRRLRQEGKSAWTQRKKLRYSVNSVFNFTDIPITLLFYCGGLALALAILGIFTVFLRGSQVVFRYPDIRRLC